MEEKKDKNDSKSKTKTSPKGILRHPSHQSNTSRSEIKQKKSIKWDEMNIIATLHPAGKDYGNMKIDEVPTPFERPSSSDGKGVDAQTLAKRLEEANVSWSSSASEEEGEEEEETLEEKKKRESFLKKRKQHYNEYIEAKKKLAELEDADDEDSDNEPSK
uniref:Protein phosphatase inhibitor 2 n=2 Tax=Cuerna arida TaxID=1464854 RepID=A0A1B6FE43_9HEMI